MRKRDKEAEAVIRDRIESQKIILAKFGQEVIGKAEKRLCSHCTMPCMDILYPITTNGEDCPYFVKMRRGRK